MARKFRKTGESGRTILLVDDDRDYLEATRLILEREGHAVITADNGPDALYVAKTEAVDLLLLDYCMPGMTGEEVLVELRKFNPLLQVILQTGYASENPPRELLKRLDIQGFFDKSEGPEKLLLWTDVGLKVANAMQLLQKSRKGLGYILSATPELYRIQPIEDLLHGILWQVSGLLGAADLFLAVMPPVTEGFLALLEEERMRLLIRAGVGKFSAGMSFTEAVPPSVSELLHETLGKGSFNTAEGITLVPLCVGDQTLGLLYLEKEIVNQTDRELLLVFANQAAVAIQNSQLYEMATMDPLTGVFVRRFFNQWVIRTLKAASRTLKPVGIIMVDMDNMKPINDTAGHLAGDRALVELVQVLKESTRSSDFIGRFGGDEFSILLPDASIEGLERVATQILDTMKDRTVAYQGGALSLKASLGLALLESPESVSEHVSAQYWQHVARFLLNEADVSLYEAKRGGKARAGKPRLIAWPGPDFTFDLTGGD